MKGIKDFFGTKGVVDNTEELPIESLRSNRKRRKNTKYDANYEVEEPSFESRSKPKKKKKGDADGELHSKKTKAKRNSKRKICEATEENIPVPAKGKNETIDLSSEESQTAEDSSAGKKKRKISSDKTPLTETETVEYSPPSTSNSLLNYFCKVDKTQTPTSSRVDKPTVLKVKALVHEPPANGDKTNQRSPKFEEVKMKLKVSLGNGRKKTKTTSKEDYDVITSESIDVPQDGLRCESKDRRLDNLVVIDLRDENSNSTFPSEEIKARPRIKHNGTLTSFFSVGDRVAKPLIELSEDRKIARQNFLLSGSPAPLKKIVSSSASQIVGSPAALPKVSHVLQRDSMHLIWNLSSVDINLRPSENRIELPGWSSVSQIHSAESNCCKESRPKPKPAVDQKKELKRLKDELKESRLPISSWFKDLRELKKNNEGQMWSEKYKPQCSSHLPLADSGNVDKFRSWLTKLKENATKEELGEVCSDDDFVTNEDSSGALPKFKRAALLTGPPGVGKTAIVYAVANELGYKVLELNASSNRSGKRILQEFSEALQSHKVETNQVFGLVSKKKGKAAKAAPPLHKQSLILIEDADLVFTDYDDGFLSTVATLAASSKRPVVFVANERKCKHLLSKVSSLLEIDVNFSSLRLDYFSTWLRTVCIVENRVLSSSLAKQLVSWSNNCDAKKCLLQLEFIQTEGFASKSLLEDVSVRGLWNSLSDYDFGASVHSTQNVVQRRCVSLLCLIDVLLSSLSTQRKNENPCPRPWETCWRDSTELNPPLANDESSSITEEIASYSLRYLDSLHHGSGCTNETSRQPSKIAQMEHSLLTPSNLLNRSAIALDFSPALRGIARSEQTRFSSQTKRNNRYFHYLRPDDCKSAMKMDYDLLVKPFETLSSDNQDVLLPT